MSNDSSITDEMGNVENISFGDIVNGLKTVANAVRLPGAPKIPYTADDTDLSGDTNSVDHWAGLNGALEVVGEHAQALLDDWDNQQENIKNYLPQPQDFPHDAAESPLVADERAIQGALQFLVKYFKEHPEMMAKK